MSEMRIEAHPRGIMTAAFSPDGGRVLLGANEQGASLWDVATGQCLRSFSGPDTAVWALQFSPDGRRALITAHDECNIWDAGSGELLQKLKWQPRGFSLGIRLGGWLVFAGFHPDGQHLLTLTSDREVVRWDLRTGKGDRILESEGRQTCDHAALSPDGSFAVSVSAQLMGAAVYYDLAKASVSAMPIHTGGLTSVAIGSAGVLTGSFDGSACLWDPKTARVLRTFMRWEPHTDPTAFRQAGKYALSEDHHHGSHIWDMTSGKTVRTFEWRDQYEPFALLADSHYRHQMENEMSGNRSYPKASENAVMSVALSADGRLAATGTHGGRVHLWDIESGQCFHTLTGFPRAVSTLAFSAQGDRLLAAGNGVSYDDKGIVRIWDVQEMLAAAPSQPEAVFPAAPDTALAQRVEDMIRHRKWDEARELLRTAPTIPEGDQNPQIVQVLSRTDYYSQHASYPFVRSLGSHAGKVNSVAISPDGCKALTAGDDGTARLWDLASARQEGMLDAGGDAFRSATFSSDGRRALVVTVSGVARLYQLPRWEVVRTAGTMDGPVDSAALSRNGQVLATVSRGRVALWDVRSGQCVGALQHSSDVVSAAFTGNDILSACTDGTLYRWRTKRGEPDRRCSPEAVSSAAVFCASYLDHAREVALTSSMDGIARLWSIEDGTCMGIAHGHRGNVVSVAPCCLGEGVAAKFAVTACDDGNAYLWSLEGGRCERRVPCPGRSAHAVAFSPKMKCMVAVSGDNEVQVWTAERK